jgi:hypothetical protein
MRLIQFLERLTSRFESESLSPNQDMFLKSDMLVQAGANDNRRVR